MADSPSSTTASEPGRLALYRRFRAQTFGEMVGQRPVVETLRNAVRLDRVGHGFLFVGPRGTGKTSMARIMAKAVNCTDLRDGEPCDACPSCVAIREGRALDVIELDAASNNKVDDMRELLPRVYTGAADLRRKVFIIDEVQRIKEGWDVLLKTLEEPPEGVLFIFCTTDPSQIRPAVVSRLQRFTFRPLPVPEIEGKLRRILEREGRQVEPDALAVIAHMAGGGMRDAESMLDQVLVSTVDPITARSVEDLLGLADSGAVDGFLAALVEGDVLAGIAVLDALEVEGRDLVAFSEQLVTRLREVLVERMSAPPEARGGVAPVAEAARRLTGVDSSRSGLGGYRWQLELCLLAAAQDAGTGVTGPSSGAPAPGTREPGAPAGQAATATPSGGPRSAAPWTTLRPAPASGPSTGMPAAASEASTPHVAATSSPGAMTTGQGTRTRGAGAPSSSSGAGTQKERPVHTERGPTAARERGAGPAASGAATADIAAIRAAWPRVVAAIGANPANRPLVSTCRPIEIRDGFLVLGFPEDQGFMRDIAERKRLILEDGIAAIVGRPVAVRCVVTNLELVEPVDTSEDDLVAQARRIFDGELAGVEDID